MTKLEREKAAIQARSLGRDAWERLRLNPMAQIGGGLFAVITVPDRSLFHSSYNGHN